MNPLRPVLRSLRRLHRRVLLHRRPLAALTVAGAVLVGLQAVAPAPPETVTVWTARRDLPSGTVLGEADLTGSPYSPGTVPADAVDDRDQVVGRTLAAPMSRGEVMTGTRTVASGLLRGYPGATAVPLRVTDAAVVDRVGGNALGGVRRKGEVALLHDGPARKVAAGSPHIDGLRWRR